MWQDIAYNGKYIVITKAKLGSVSSLKKYLICHPLGHTVGFVFGAADIVQYKMILMA